MKFSLIALLLSVSNFAFAQPDYGNIETCGFGLGHQQLKQYVIDNVVKTNKETSSWFGGNNPKCINSAATKTSDCDTSRGDMAEGVMFSQVKPTWAPGRIYFLVNPDDGQAIWARSSTLGNFADQYLALNELSCEKCQSKDNPNNNIWSPSRGACIP